MPFQSRSGGPHSTNFVPHAIQATLIFTDLPLAGDFADFETLHRIFVAREGRLLSQLAEAMGNRKGDMFDTWMKQ